MKLTLALITSLSVSAFALDPHVEAVTRIVEAAKGKVEKTEDGQSLKLVDLQVPNAGPHDHRKEDPYDAAFFEHLGHKDSTVRLKTRKVGDLSVEKNGDMLYLDFPSRPPEPARDVPASLIAGLNGIPPLETYISRDYMLVYPDSKTIRAINPDYKILGQCGKFVIITAQASTEDDCDFVSRFFCAGDGIEEDPVTGSAHCNLIPYWAKRLGKTRMVGKQLSPRGGTLLCELREDRVLIGGKALTYLEGTISV